MALENMNNMLRKAYKEHYAVGQFNINNVEWTSAILETAEKTRTPVILGVTVSAAKYMGWLAHSCRYGQRFNGRSPYHSSSCFTRRSRPII